MIRLSHTVEEQLRRHCEGEYPNEACGVLFGHGDGTASPWCVTEIKALPNTHNGDHKRRYLVPPDFQFQAEKHALTTNQDILGYYHSHPDHPAQPSENDRVHGWFGYLYLICSVQQGRSNDLKGFSLEDQGGVFLDVDVKNEPLLEK
jgi:proteasome lid subunit RPN8/RPN11